MTDDYVLWQSGHEGPLLTLATLAASATAARTPGAKAASAPAVGATKTPAPLMLFWCARHEMVYRPEQTTSLFPHP